MTHYYPVDPIAQANNRHATRLVLKWVLIIGAIIGVAGTFCT